MAWRDSRRARSRSIVYDRFDLWQVNVDGSNPVRLTRGREDSTVYRCASEGGGGGGGGGRGGFGAGARSAPCALDGEAARTIDTSKPLMLSATGEYNKKSGYASADDRAAGCSASSGSTSSVAPRERPRTPTSICSRNRRSRSRRTISWPAPRLSDAKQVSHTNAFQSDYAWGKQMLMTYTNKRGDKLQMMLTYPADYQPGKKYPMVVYYYEKLSQGFHQYVVPSDRQHVQHVGVQPERILRAAPRHPVPGAQSRLLGPRLRDVGGEAPCCATVSDIDPKRVGNMGHSWGGYQSAFYAVHGHGVVRGDDRRRAADGSRQLVRLHVGQLRPAGDGPLRDGPGAHAGVAVGGSAGVHPQLDRVLRWIRCRRRCCSRRATPTAT